MVVIIGAGMAGAASAYYLCRQHNFASGTGVTILDAAGPAACSSGTAGAYLSAAWGDQTKRESLFRKSFALHEELARDLCLKSFHCVPSYRVDLEQDGDADQVETADNRINRMATTSREAIKGPSAVVDPDELTRALLQDALSRGAQFRKQSVERFDVNQGKDGRKLGVVTGIHFENNSTLALAEDEKIVLAIGPWSARIEDWFASPMPIDGVLSTSVIWDDASTTSLSMMLDAAYFCEEDSNGCHLEILPRSDNSLYVSGCGESAVLSPAEFRSAKNRPRPQDPCTPNMARADAALKSIKDFVVGSAVRPPDQIRACVRPMSPDGVPIVGKLKNMENVYVATGGGEWGLTWGPLIGKCMASLLLDDDENGTSITAPVRLATLAPNRFDTIVYQSLLKQRKDHIS